MKFKIQIFFLPKMNTQLLNETVRPENKKDTHIKTNWIWNYWDEEIQEVKGEHHLVMICKVIDGLNQIPCGKIYIKSKGSTGNAISHLRNIHNITKNRDQVC